MKTSDIFWKCWWWSAACGTGVAILFLIVTALPFLDWLFKLVPFFDVLVGVSVVGCFIGAGYVGSRIAAKYYKDAKGYTKRYVRFSTLAFAALVALAFSPVSFLMILWSFIAPCCVLLTLSGIAPKQEMARTVARRARGRTP